MLRAINSVLSIIGVSSGPPNYGYVFSWNNRNYLSLNYCNRNTKYIYLFTINWKSWRHIWWNYELWQDLNIKQWDLAFCVKKWLIICILFICLYLKMLQNNFFITLFDIFTFYKSILICLEFKSARAAH